MNIPENFDRWMFDYKEGNLSGSEMETFENFLIQNPEFEIDADAWNQAFVQHEEFSYPNQSALRKDRKVKALYGWSAAALLLLLFGIGGMFVLNSNSDAVDGFAAENIKVHNTSDVKIVNSDKNEQSKINVLNVLSDGGDSESLSASTNLNNSIFNNSSYFNSPEINQTILDLGHTNLDNNSVYENAESKIDPSQMQSMDQEFGKFNNGEYSGKYQSNPEIKDLNFDVNKNKSNNNYRSFGKTVKQFYKKIEKMLDYPVGLTNLRDPNLGIAENSILGSNPGFTGGMLAPRFEMNYRNQWFGSNMNSQEMTISFDNYSYEMRGGLGVMINAKDYGMGAYGDYNISLLYSPKFVVNPNVVFEPAIKMTMGILTASGDKLNANSAVEFERGRLLNTGDEAQMIGSQQLWYKDYGLGFVLNTKWFYAGFSADNLANHYENVFSGDQATPTASPVKMNALLGFDYESEKSKNSIKINRSVSPYLIYNQLGNRKNIWAGCNLRFDWLTIGGSYSTSQEYTASLGMQFQKFKMMYRYDMTESMFLGEQVGSHNIGVRFNATRKKARLH